MKKNMKLSLGLFIFTVFFAYISWTIMSSYNSYKKWPETEGIIISMVIKQVPHDFTVNNRGGVVLAWGAFAEYTYSVGGKVYTGKRISTSEEFQDYKQPTNSLTHYLTKYPQGSNVQVHYNPSKPERSILEIDTFMPYFFSSLTLLLFLAFIGSIILFLKYK